MVIKQMLNNNVVVAVNDKNEEVVVMGRGLAFGAKKGQAVPEEKIEKVFANVKGYDFDYFAKLMSEIDLGNFQFTESLIDYAREQLGQKLNNSIYITLTDHINTLFERAESEIYIKNTMLWDIKRLYKKEFEVSKSIVEMINKKLNSKFDDNEAASIAMHIVNAKLETDMETAVDITNVMSEILNIVKYHFKILYKEDSLAYSRFLTHLAYFAQRVFNNSTYAEDNDDELFEIVKVKYSDIYECTKVIKDFLIKEYKYELDNSECLYLTIHIAKVVKDSRKL